MLNLVLPNPNFRKLSTVGTMSVKLPPVCCCCSCCVDQAKKVRRHDEAGTEVASGSKLVFYSAGKLLQYETTLWQKKKHTHTHSALIWLSFIMYCQMQLVCRTKNYRRAWARAEKLPPNGTWQNKWKRKCITKKGPHLQHKFDASWMYIFFFPFYSDNNLPKSTGHKFSAKNWYSVEFR